MAKIERNAANLNLGKTQEQRAIAFGQAASATELGTLQTVAEHKEGWQGGPLTVLLALMKERTPAVLNEWPEPGNKEGNNPDLILLKKKDANGNEVVRETSFYNVLVASTPAVQKIDAELKAIAVMNSKDPDMSKVPADVQKMNPVARETRRVFLNGRKATIGQAYKKAMSLFCQLDRVNSVPNLNATIMFADKEKTMPASATSPIKVFEDAIDGQASDNWDVFSIAAFLRIDAAAATEKGGGLQAAKDTLKRDTDKKGANLPDIQSPETAGQFIENLHVYFDRIFRDKEQKEVGKFYKAVNGAGTDELCESIVETYQFLEDVIKANKLMDRYTKLQSEGGEKDAA